MRANPYGTLLLHLSTGSSIAWTRLFPSNPMYQLRLTPTAGFAESPAKS